MKNYFLLQLTLLNRRFDTVGIHHTLAWPLCGLLLVVFGELVYTKTRFASSLVLLSAFSFLISIGKRKRNEFLQVLFGDKGSSLIRLIENLLISVPFILLLLWHKSTIEAGILLILAIPLSFFSLDRPTTFTIKTPFYRWPFEFAVGVRNTWYFLPFCFLLMGIGISVNNMNLAIAGGLSPFLLAFTFYIKPEDEFYTWVHSFSPQQFLWHKIKIAVGYMALFLLPTLLCLLVFYPENALNLGLFVLLGFVLLALVILAKYAAYPNEMHLPEIIMLGITIYFPPLILGIGPYFYARAIKKLKLLLQ